MIQSDSRLRVVFTDLRRAVDDVILKHQVTPDELSAVLDWLQETADAGELRRLRVLFFKTVLRATEGADYAHPEKDGASNWDMGGSAYRPGAPVLHSPAVLPMRPDEPGEPLFVSGAVRTTAGDPVPGAVLEVWQIGADDIYSGIDTSDFLPLNIPNDSSGIPEWNLRATIVADGDGHYEFRTVMPGTETLGLDPDGPLGALTESLRLPGLRPLHIHSIVTADGMLPLTTQIYFDGDPLVEAAIEGPVPAASVETTTVHDDSAGRPYRTLTHDYVLRTR
ncbi:hypothetical protein ACIA8K_25085 [Catenuloplanes sp. NPDC051500]|uniref:dioxygenase family protein n=1 Tax=Catenuloplanes sp. NPDC051500 TaxID=3363959 RepID=UPI00379DD079